jgi:hypothetical protein
MIFLLFSYVFLNSYTISGVTLIQDSAVVAFVELFDQPPPGAYNPIDYTISNEDGQYSFDIINPGMYYVKAYIIDPSAQYLYYENTPNPYQATPVQVNNMNPNATGIDFNFFSNIIPGDNSLSGVITDPDTMPVEEARVVLYALISPWMMPFCVYSDINGNYVLENIPDGEYLLSVWRQSYHPYFYNAVPSWPMATPIVLENGTAIVIDVILEPHEMYTITGIVMDGQTNLPLEGAVIFPLPQNMQGDYPGGGMMYYGISNENGYYELTVPDGIYMVMASDSQTADIQFYQNAATPITATWIIVDDDISNIDFILNEPLNGEFSISGTITVDGEVPEPGIPIEAVAVSSEEDWEEAVMANFMTGEYIIPNLPAGDYYVFAYSPYTPLTYYDNVISFEDAILVGVQGNVSGINIDIQLPQVNGYYQCTGTVMDNLRNPVSNVTVAFLDSFGNIHNYTYTDMNGEYNVPALGNLNYTALATKTFYSTDTVTLPVYGNQTWDFTITSVNTDIEQDIVNVEDNITIQIYPNPFNPETVISFTLSHTSTRTEVEIFNVRGQNVFSKTLSNLTAGSYAIAWKAEDEQKKSLGSGVYFLRIIADSHIGTGKLLLIK